MHISADDRDDVRIMTVCEDRIDAANAVHFKETVAGLANGAPERVVLDMDRVDFIDSSGLGAIVASMKQLAPDRKLELAGLNDTVSKVFRLTRMDSVFPIHGTVEAALAEQSHAN